MQVTPLKFFKAGSWMLIVISALHLMGHFLMSKPVNDTEENLLGFMSNYHKEFFGGKMTMKEILDGLNLFYSLFLASFGSLNLVLTRSAEFSHRYLRQISFIGFITFLVGAVIALIYFFWMHVLALFLVSACFLTCYTCLPSLSSQKTKKSL
jgi:hypothetical protein